MPNPWYRIEVNKVYATKDYSVVIYVRGTSRRSNVAAGLTQLEAYRYALEFSQSPNDIAGYEYLQEGK